MRKAVKGTTPTLHCNPPAAFCGGFSLIELLIALVLLVAVLTLAPPIFNKGLSSAEFKSSVRLVAAGLRSAQAQAITRNQERLFILDLEKRQFSLGTELLPTQLPASLTLKMKTAESEQISESEGGIRFFPDGSSTGGAITVTSGDTALSLSVDWITGRVTIHDAE
ncbi:MAG: GspH/FimT family protein [Chromatiaceae bacterium]|nr:GspH/FimT family protein [Gammaproteobacteria bacterium]MCB1862020.1 GspH/FimT family protein [Gammaproteobacteria bacterium]MCB1880848.1 GspH/FimT family protein [Gammaproteobacteria bacterium]MCP5445751.1 GspH/FimT family protein [Chromatiaceae bacterium]